MKSIYDYAIEQIAIGEKFYINLKSRTLLVGKKFIISKGKMSKNFSGYGINVIEGVPNILSVIDELYDSFRTSVPSENSDNNQGRYFRGLSVDRLSDYQLAHGENRQVARFRLEFFILVQLISGSFSWDDPMLLGKWFYQSATYPSLVLRRDSLGL